jgi:hypothetical protein
MSDRPASTEQGHICSIGTPLFQGHRCSRESRCSRDTFALYIIFYIIRIEKVISNLFSLQVFSFKVFSLKVFFVKSYHKISEFKIIFFAHRIERFK